MSTAAGLPEPCWPGPGARARWGRPCRAVVWRSAPTTRGRGSPWASGPTEPGAHPWATCLWTRPWRRPSALRAVLRRIRPATWASTPLKCCCPFCKACPPQPRRKRPRSRTRQWNRRCASSCPCAWARGGPKYCAPPVRLWARCWPPLRRRAIPWGWWSARI